MSTIAVNPGILIGGKGKTVDGFDKKDEELLARFGLTKEQVERDVTVMEDENADHGIIGPIYYGSHAYGNPGTSIAPKDRNAAES